MEYSITGGESMDTYERILEECFCYNVITIGANGYPFNVSFTSIFHREGHQILYFLISDDSKIVKNIESNPKGSVSCSTGSNEANIETLTLEGMFSIEKLDTYQELKIEIAHLGKILGHEKTQLLKFEMVETEVNNIVNLGLYYNWPSSLF